MSRRQDTDPARPVDLHMAHRAAIKEVGNKGEAAYLAAHDRIAAGLTVREEFAKAALQGLLANEGFMGAILDQASGNMALAAPAAGLAAVAFADATIAQLGLNEGEEG